MAGFMSATGAYGTGRVAWGASSDNEGNRTYTVTHRVRTLKDDGPLIARNTAGLPLIGSFWNFGNEADLFATRMPASRVSVVDNTSLDPARSGGTDYQYWDIEDQFSTRPINRCQDTTIEDPLQEPDRVSGSFTKLTKEAREDFEGDLIRTSSFELVFGPEVEIDDARHIVVIEQNVINPQISLVTAMMNTVWAGPSLLWGMPARTVKLSDFSWSRKYFGSCTIYYTRRLAFEINANTFDDSKPVDQGTKALQGKWIGGTSAPRTWEVGPDIDGIPPDPTKPHHFIRVMDANNRPMHTMLNGEGVPLIDGANPKPIPLVTEKGALKLYKESNFLLLNIPVVF